MSDDEDVDELLRLFREIATVEFRHDYVEDGLYKGCHVRYANGVEMFHPYTPLMVTTVDGTITHQNDSTMETRHGTQRFVGGYPVYADMMPSPSSSKH